MNGWDVIEYGPRFCATKQIGVVCISVELVDGGYLPTLSMDDYGDVVSSGRPMRSLELAIESADALVPLHMRAVCMSFRPFAEGADEIVEVPSV